MGVAVPDRFPRVRRIALSIKSEDFSRRITPASDPAKSVRGEPSDLNTIVTSSEGSLRVSEAASTDLTG
jgi:hypothetical protein